ncbi:UNVERIFIED_CONTAM: hypothetical protein Slati_2256900, partial [Sesamum latifolium]
ICRDKSILRDQDDRRFVCTKSWGKDAIPSGEARRPLPGLAPRVLQRPPRPPTHRGLALARRPGIGRALQRHPFSGLVDSAVSLRASTRVSSGFAPLRHSSPSFGSRQVCSLEPFSEDQGRSTLHPSGGSRRSASLPHGFTRPLTRTHVRLLGPCFKTGRMGSPLASAGSAQLPRHARGARCPPRSGDGIPGISTARALAPPQSALVRAPSRSADRLSPFHIRPGRIAGPHPLPSRQFQALFDSLFKVLFIFPSRYLFAIGLSPVFSLGRNLRPIGAAFPNNPTRRQRLVVRQGPGTTGLSPSPAPLSRGLGPGPPLRTLLQTTIRTAKPPDSQRVIRLTWGRGRRRGRLWVQRDAPSGRRHDSTRVEGSTTTGRDERRRGDRIWAGRARRRTGGQSPPPAPGEGATRCVTPSRRALANGFGRNLRSKTRWFTGFCNSHQVSHFATFFIDARAEISVAESRFDIRETSPPPVHPANGASRGGRFVEFSLARPRGGSLARTARARAPAGGAGRGIRPAPGPDCVDNAFAVCFCRFRQ